MTQNATTKDERSLLLFFETCMVDNAGKVDARHMNKGDFTIADRWTKSGFIRFWRLPAKIMFELKDKYNITASYQLEFSPEAWEEAHAERRARSNRLIKQSVDSGLKTGWADEMI